MLCLPKWTSSGHLGNVTEVSQKTRKSLFLNTVRCYFYCGNLLCSPETDRTRMAAQSQSWRNLTVPAKLFIGLVVTVGTGVLLFGAIHQSSKNIAQFICYLGIAVLASRMKVNLPGITGTMSVNFLFVLLGVLELSFSETLILGCVSILVQSLVSGSAERDPGHLQRMRGCAFDRSGLLCLSPSILQSDGR